MKTLPQWLALYGESHQNKTNQVLHKICVPLIFWSILAVLWLIPLGPVPLLVPVVLAILVFYFRLGFTPGLLMLAQTGIALALSIYVEELTGQLLWIAISVFIAAWIGQFIGHGIEGKKPSFLEDLLFLLIGPLWVFQAFFKK